MHLIAFYNGRTLFIQTDRLVSNGRMRLIDQTGKLRAEYFMNNIDFISVAVTFPAGKYLMQIQSGDEIAEKYVYI